MPTMPESLAIECRGVGKRYDIYARNSARALDLITASPGKRARPFWALSEVSFDVARGEAVGIVGRNGSGKSTLMQIIAGTLSPTTGTVRIRGRVSALLELGSGFNPAFTGRENVFLAGTILGLSRREMERRFDDVAAFADIGEFLEQPVEVYSSGMHARLAFSVAICVEPDILIVDEILSVGDAGFQQRCITRMRQMLDSGVTLLFVSHAADMVKSICSKALFLSQGKSHGFGAAGEMVDRYTQSLRATQNERAMQRAAQTLPPVPLPATTDPDAADREGTGHARITGVRLLDAQGRPTQAVIHGERVCVEVSLAANTPVEKLDVIVRVRDKAGVILFGFTAIDEGVRLPPMAAGETARVRFVFTSPLAPGPHGIGVSLLRRRDQAVDEHLTLDHVETAVAFDSLQGKKFVRGKVSVQAFAERVVEGPVAAG
ncbi:MAG: ABC transporter ATP-binding protein [Phycisphaerales bacterium]|nr:ABC transporter ATP-binding protein [Phycisphaerales bacterium]